MEKNHWVYLANKDSDFDTGTIVVQLDQKDSDSYFRVVGCINGKLVVKRMIFPTDIDFEEIKIQG